MEASCARIFRSVVQAAVRHQLGLRKGLDYLAVDPLDQGRIPAGREGRLPRIGDDFGGALRRPHLLRVLLELRRLAHVVAPLHQEGDDGAVQAVDVPPDLRQVGAALSQAWLPWRE